MFKVNRFLSKIKNLSQFDWFSFWILSRAIWIYSQYNKRTVSTENTFSTYSRYICDGYITAIAMNTTNLCHRPFLKIRHVQRNLHTTISKRSCAKRSTILCMTCVFAAYWMNIAHIQRQSQFSYGLKHISFPLWSWFTKYILCHIQHPIIYIHPKKTHKNVSTGNLILIDR